MRLRSPMTRWLLLGLLLVIALGAGAFITFQTFREKAMTSAPQWEGATRHLVLGYGVHSGAEWSQAAIGVGSQGRPARAAWIASMARMPWPLAVTR
ncbi:hypothetical protein Mth01_57070 [Sphaerimonospora thailandensis]|uniref:Uncharacterized protein n=1 Tax=Sphaerimonospora thailandensis TaxID=795644 RepID=A0A8J3REN4_9ACTN|nr:hypothetical protein Mth01_57070 [Sphaerimonospora thailandensis]